MTHHRFTILPFLFCLLAICLGPDVGRCAAEEAPLVVYDMVPGEKVADFAHDPALLRRHYDEVLLVTCLQAIVNRQAPRLFVRYNAAPDDYWLARAHDDPHAWLSARPVERLSNDLPALLARFAHEARGLVVWDERTPATSNVAATIAGVEDLLALRYDPSPGSLYTQLTTTASSDPSPLPVVRRLLAPDGGALFTGQGQVPDTGLPSSGSAKCDTYLWLLEHYVKPGKTNPRLLGYYLDAHWLQSWQNGQLYLHTLNNLDFILAHRGVVCDLDAWEDEAPVDDPTQPPGTDGRTFANLLRACDDALGGKEMIACYGFTPWAFKYTNFKTPHWDAGGTHKGVPTEWHLVEVLSAYNAYLEADAISYSSLPNASLYQHFPLPSSLSQPHPEKQALIKSGVLDKEGRLLPVHYYAHYQGSYDSAAWLYWQVPKMWDDPARGTLPLSWAMNPNLGIRFGFGLAFLRQSAKPGEVWLAGEGAGYLMPANLRAPRPSGLPDALDVWTRHCQRLYRQWDLRVTGFDIDGDTAPLDERSFAAYRSFSPGGVGLQHKEYNDTQASGVMADVPFVTYDGDLPGGGNQPNVDNALKVMEKAFGDQPLSQPGFHMFRAILRKPSFYAEVEHRLDAKPTVPARKLVDLPTLLWLIKEYHDNTASHPVAAH